MKQVMVDLKKGNVTVEEVPSPILKENGVVVQNYYSVVSSGTDKSLLDLASSSYLGKARKKPDLFKKVIDKAKKEGPLAAYEQAMGRLNKPEPMGYSSAGVVLEASDDVPFEKGDHVACAGSGFAVHADRVFVPKNLCVKIPENVSLKEASFTTMGSIAMQGVRNAHVTLGDRVAVIGLGLIGNLTVQILKAAGCQVFGIDIDSDKVEFAKKFGLDDGANRSDDNIMNMTKSFTQGYGFDSIIITAATESTDPLYFAGLIARKNATVVLVGVVGMHIPRDIYYEKELNFIVSCSYGPGRYDRLYEELGIDYPIEYVRWTEKRNMESFLELVSDGKIQLNELISHEFQITDAKKAYDLVVGKTEEKFMGVLFSCNSKIEEQNLIKNFGTKIQTKKIKGEIGIGFIGAGQFASSVLLPALKKVANTTLIGVCAATGLSAKSAKDNFSFQYCTNDYKEILNDDNIDLIIIATRNSLHSKIIIESLEAGKHVFTEKPLATNKHELDSIIKVKEENPDKIIQVGFNRRFAPMTQKIKRHLKTNRGPLMVFYRVNAEHLPKDHWIYDQKEGNSRFISELCHFIDFSRFISDSEIIDSNYTKINSKHLHYKEQLENVSMTLKFKNGSVATILYNTIGDTSSSKEYVEIIGSDLFAYIKDFKHMEINVNGKTKKENYFLKSKKGHKEELEFLINSIKKGNNTNDLFNESIEVTKITLNISK